MKLTMILGIVLLMVGTVAAAIGMSAVGAEAAVAVPAEASPLGQAARDFVLPALAGLFLAAGATLVGVSMGNWTRPRTHLEPGDRAVDPEGYHKMKHV